MVVVVAGTVTGPGGAAVAGTDVDAAVAVPAVSPAAGAGGAVSGTCVDAGHLGGRRRHREPHDEAPAMIAGRARKPADSGVGPAAWTDRVSGSRGGSPGTDPPGSRFRASAARALEL